jgi:hypothetical protein
LKRIFIQRRLAVVHSLFHGRSGFTRAVVGPRVTLEEWSGLPEDVPGEFVDGRLVEEEVPDYLHEVLVAWLARELGNWSEQVGAIVGGSEAKFALSPARGRKADLSVYLAGRRPPAPGIVRSSGYRRGNRAARSAEAEIVLV